MIDVIGPAFKKISIFIDRMARRENIFLQSLIGGYVEFRLMCKLKMLLLSLKGVVNDAEKKD